jgi:hypothetical protein
MLGREHGFQTRSDWHGVYMDLNVFAEYAANNPSSSMVFIWSFGNASGSEIP